MNKKFSTLVAVLLAAGAWTTLDAKVIEVTTPKAGGSYLIGLNLGDGTVTSLLQASDMTSTNGASAVTDATNAWMFEAVENEEGVFYLKAGDKYIKATGTDKGIELAEILDAACVKFKVVSDEIVVAAVPTASSGTTTIAADDELKLTDNAAATIVAAATNSVKFAVYGADDVYPGVGEVAVDDKGEVTDFANFLEKANAATASFYLQDAAGKFLYVDATGAVKTADKAQATAAFSWALDVSKKVYSVAKDRADADAKYLNTQTTRAAGAWELVAEAKATAATAAADGLTVGIGKIATISVSAVAATAATTFSATVNSASQTLAVQTSFEADEYYVIAGAASKAWKGGADSAVTVDEINNPTDLNEYLWKIEKTSKDGVTRYQFVNKATQKVAILNKVFDFIASNEYDGGMYLAVEGQDYLDADLTNTAAAVSFGIYKSPEVKSTVNALNNLLNKGFNLTIKKTAADNSEIKGLEAFGGKLTATTDAGITGDETRFRLKSGEKFVVLNKKATWSGSNVGSHDRGYKFQLVDAVTADHVSWFEFKSYAGNTADEIELVSVFADEQVATPAFGSLYILSLGDLNCLTTSDALVDNKEAWPFIKLGADNFVKPEDFLKKAFFTVTKLDETNGNTILAANDCDDADFVKAVGNKLEAQWAVAYDETTKQYSFVNRENQNAKFESWTAASVRENDNLTDNIYVIDGVSYKIEPVEDAKESDGYMWLGDVKNQRYAMAHFSDVYKNEAWFTQDKDGKVVLDIDETKATEMTAASVVDTIKVESSIDYYEGAVKKTEKNTLKVPVYAFSDLAGKKFAYVTDKYMFNGAQGATADVLAIREDEGKYNLRLTDGGAFECAKIYAGTSVSYLDKTANLYDNTKNDLFIVEALNRPEYRRLGATVTDGLADMDVNNVKFYRTNDENTFLYENSANRNANNGDAILNFLGETNLADKPANAALAIFVDTAYVRNNTAEPLYLLSVRNKFTPAGKYNTCPDKIENCHQHPTIETAAFREGAYLVGLKDSADIKQAQYQTKFRMAFVDAKHIEDTLVIANSAFTGTKDATKDSLFFSNKGVQTENAATFSFRLVDPAADNGDFYIETVDGQYVRIHNSVPVLVDELTEAATFNVEKTDEQATSNEGIATTGVTVSAVNGAVVVKGAEGKKVVITNVLGQTIANTVVTSSEATISAPQGVVVVAVEGEAAVKAIVK